MKDNRTDYSIYNVSNKAQQHLKRAFRLSKQDPNAAYDLFPITVYLQDYLDYNQRERCRLTTTLEIMKAIKYMVDNDLF